MSARMSCQPTLPASKDGCAWKPRSPPATFEDRSSTRPRDPGCERPSRRSAVQRKRMPAWPRSRSTRVSHLKSDSAFNGVASGHRARRGSPPPSTFSNEVQHGCEEEAPQRPPRTLSGRPQTPREKGRTSGHSCSPSMAEPVASPSTRELPAHARLHQAPAARHWYPAGYL